jgi:MOSC domain-containing protein YiiM
VTTCAECGFDGSQWSGGDLDRTLVHAADLAAVVVADWAGAPEPLVPGSTAGEPVEAVHALMHRLDELAELRRAAEPFDPMTGTVASIQSSRGGVPKRPVDAAVIDRNGIVGDVQGNRVHHGRPWQAVCIYSRDVIDALAADGHPIEPGGAGENLTIAGIDWSRLRGGLTISIGDVRLRTTSPTTPCRKIAACFADRRFDRIHHDRHPGWSRWYASVRTGGTIRPGDEIVVTS